MATTTNTGMRQTIKRARRAWAEMDYAQRRLFEIRTGISAAGQDERVRPVSSAEELESHYQLEPDERAA